MTSDTRRVVIYRVPTPPGKSHKVLDFFLKFPGPGKSWNLPAVQLNQHAFYV